MVLRLFGCTRLQYLLNIWRLQSFSKLYFTCKVMANTEYLFYSPIQGLSLCWIQNLPNIYCHIIFDCNFVSNIGHTIIFMGLLIIPSPVNKLFIDILWNHEKQSKLLQYIGCSLSAKLIYLWSKIYIYSLLFIHDTIKHWMQWMWTDHINLEFIKRKSFAWVGTKHLATLWRVG